jgi:uncharacterized membrane protein YecN with MAPEG domain
MLTITSIYAALCGLLLVALSMNVIRFRAHNGVSLGDGDHKELRIAIRAQGNFVEYTPIALILLGLCELQGATGLFLHLTGALLFLSRVLHAVGLGGKGSRMRMRQAGMIITFTVIVVMALRLLFGVL